MRKKIENQLLMNKGSVVSEQSPTIAGFRSWIAIYAISVDLISRTPDGLLRLPKLDRNLIRADVNYIYAIRQVQVRAECIEKDWDLGPDDVMYGFVEIAYHWQDIFRVLTERGIDDETFVEPWNCDYPL